MALEVSKQDGASFMHHSCIIMNHSCIIEKERDENESGSNVPNKNEPGLGEVAAVSFRNAK